MKKLLLLSLLFITTLSQANDSCIVDSAVCHYSRDSMILDTQETIQDAIKSKILYITGKCSYYAHKFHGRLQANGKRYNMYAMTAAHKSYKFGTKLRVTNLKNGLSVIVTVTDRGPFIKGRHLDLSLKAAQVLKMIKSGTANCKIEVLNG